MNGNHIVDQFFAVENITISANGKTPVSFVWTVPNYVLSGDYQLVTYFVTSNKFNLLGLSFTDDIVGNSFDFKVTGEQTGGVFFDKNSSVVDGGANAIITQIPRVSKTDPVKVSIDVSNTLKHATVVPLVWTLYYWDGLLEEHILDTKTEEISIDANKSVTVSYTINDSVHAVYYLVGKVQYNDSSSFVNTRLVREEVPEIRVNFPSLMKYPVEKGVPNTIFSCLHGAGVLDVVENGKLEVVLETPTGKKVDSFIFEGPITGAMMVKAHEFTPRATYDNLVLKSNLFLDGILVDTTRIEYRCEEINPTNCVSGSFDENASRSKMILITIIGIVGIVLVVGIILWRIKKHESAQT